MKKNVIVLGIGRFGYAIATKLFERGAYVTAVDSNYDTVERIADKVSSAVQADITESVAMNSLGISNYDMAIIATGSNLEASIEATLICKDSGVEKVIAKASSKTHARILKKIGADQIVYPEIDTAENLARTLTGSDVLEYIQLSDDFSVLEVKAKENWIGKTVEELDFRKRHQLNLIAIKEGEELFVDFNPDWIIKEGSILILLGSSNRAQEIEKNS